MTTGLIWSGYIHKGCGGKIVGKNNYAHCEECNECIRSDNQTEQVTRWNRGRLFYIRFWRDTLEENEVAKQELKRKVRCEV